MTDVAMYSIEAEQQLLGAVMVDNRVFHRCSDIVSAETFFDPVHSELWKICAARILNGETVSPVILNSMTAAIPGLQDLGGGRYLVRMAGACVGSSAAPDYARLLNDMWQRRTVAESLQGALQAVQGGGPVSEALNVLTAVGEALRAADGQPASISFLAALAQAVKTMTADDEDDAGGVLTGLKEFDQTVGRLRRGDSIIIGGRPSMGKTALALWIAGKVARQAVVENGEATRRGVGVAIVSLEMTGESLAHRSIAEATGVEYSRLADRSADENEVRRALIAAQRMQDTPIEIVQPHIKDLHAINAALVRIKHSFEARGIDLGLVVIDYLQLIRAPGKDPQQQVSAASKGVKALAMQLDVPVVTLSQLSRALESRDNKRPVMSDLRESGSIEQDADLILFCYRDEYYLEREKPVMSGSKDKDAGLMADWETGMRAARNRMEVIVAKKRMGRIGTATVGFNAGTNRFWSLLGDNNEQVEF